MYNKPLDYNKAIEVTGGDTDNFVNRGYIYHVMGKYVEAERDYTKSIELDQNNETSFNNRSSILNTLGHYEQVKWIIDNSL